MEFKESVLEKECYHSLRKMFLNASLHNLKVSFLKDGVSEIICFGSLIFIHTETKREDLYQVYVSDTNESLFFVGRNKKADRINCFQRGIFPSILIDYIKEQEKKKINATV
jgi:hypothetical protein